MNFAGDDSDAAQAFTYVSASQINDEPQQLCHTNLFTHLHYSKVNYQKKSWPAQVAVLNWFAGAY